MNHPFKDGIKHLKDNSESLDWNKLEENAKTEKEIK